MIKVINFILHNSIESVLRVYEKELSFHMGYYDFVIKLNDCSFLKSLSDEAYIDINELDFSEFSMKYIDDICIQSGTPIYVENGRDFCDNMFSYSFTANRISQQLNKVFTDSIYDAKIGFFSIEDSCIWCDEMWLYGFIIKFRENYWNNIDLYKFIILNCFCNSLSDINIPNFYSLEDEILDDFTIDYLPSNTKTRRLGYLKILLSMFNDNSKIPTSVFNQRFEKNAQAYNRYLNTHKNNKGIIVETKTGNSAVPYIELANSLGLIHRNTIFCEIGKMGKVYSILKKRIDTNLNEDPFQMTDFDTEFFLELLLKKDFLYIYIILQFVCQNEHVTYNTLKQNFQKEIIKRIRIILTDEVIHDSQKILRLKTIEKRISSWEKTMTYLEHILMPRINWLFDLGVIHYANNVLSFTPKGQRLYYNISIWDDIKFGVLINPNEFINTYYMHVWADINGMDIKKYESTDKTILQKCIDECFLSFKTLAPNRATFSLTANYCKNILYWKYSILIDINDIKHLFEKDLNDLYIYKYQQQYSDGYIQKRN